MPTTTTTTTTTVPPAAAPRPGWLPPADVATALYPIVPGRLVVADEVPLLLGTVAPTGTGLGQADPDRDGRAGITLVRSTGAAASPGSRLWLAFEAHDEFRVAGPVSATVYAGGTGLLPGTVELRATVFVCDGAGACTPGPSSTRSVLASVLTQAVAFDLGTVDLTVPQGGSLRLAVEVPSTSGGDVVVFAGTLLTPTAVTFTFR